MFDHPNLEKERLEEMLLECYDEEFRRLGPSPVRFMEKQLKGYLKFRDSDDPLLKMRAEQYRELCEHALPLLPTAIRKGW